MGWAFVVASKVVFAVISCFLPGCLAMSSHVFGLALQVVLSIGASVCTGMCSTHVVPIAGVCREITCVLGCQDLQYAKQHKHIRIHNVNLDVPSHHHHHQCQS